MANKLPQLDLPSVFMPDSGDKSVYPQPILILAPMYAKMSQCVILVEWGCLDQRVTEPTGLLESTARNGN